MSSFNSHMRMRFITVTLLPILLLLLSSCSQPLPPEKQDYAGYWQGENMTLLITRDGSVSYKRFSGGMKKSIEAPLKAFHGDDFEVGLSFVTTLFEVQQPPREQDGIWTMTVDGVVLTRLENR